MRRATIHVPVAGYRIGDRMRVFGPDASGALATAAAMATGAAPVSAARPPEPTAWEGTQGAETAFARVEYAGAWNESAWSGPAWQEPRAVSVLGIECEYGVQQHAAEAVDGVGQVSSGRASGGVLIVASPARPDGLSVSVAAGVVTVTSD